MKRKNSLRAGIAIILLLGFAATTGPLLAASKEEIAKKKADIRKMANETLARLYKVQPSAKQAVSNAAGYAVFSNFGMKIFFAGGGSGKGLAVDNKTKKETFMKMVELQAGLGMGIKKFRLVWVFETQSGLNSFVNSGWEFGGQATAAAQASGQGGSVCRGHVHLPGCVALSTDGRRPGPGTHRQRNQVLQGW